ncbi:MAG: Ribosomal large subunit methyltransferase [Pseudomonadota bacterium]
MNYRHAFHAGNFCDVLKHATLALIIEHMKQKPTPFRVLDVHGGAGLYRLDADEAERTGEWRRGIGKIIGPGIAPPTNDVAAVLAPYLDVITKLNKTHGRDISRDDMLVYPGSPILAAALLRDDDALVANELHPTDSQLLARQLKSDARARVTAVDAYAAIKANLPPPSRRGVLLIDPPFEEPGEWDRMIAGWSEAQKRFATGTTVIWYPRKDIAAVEQFHRRATALVPARLMRVELDVADGRMPDMLFGNGLLIHNPPWQLDAGLKLLLPFLRDRLKTGPHARFRIDWLKPPA